jgi:hypothetical protein
MIHQSSFYTAIDPWIETKVLLRLILLLQKRGSRRGLAKGPMSQIGSWAKPRGAAMSDGVSARDLAGETPRSVLRMP